MPRASHDRLHRAMFGASTPLPPTLWRTCYAQLFVAATMLLLATGSLAMGWSTLGESETLAGGAVAYALSVLACWRDKGLYIRLMCIWCARPCRSSRFSLPLTGTNPRARRSLLSAGAIVAGLRALSRPAARERIGITGLLVPCALHAAALALNVTGVVVVLNPTKGRKTHSV